MKIDFSKLEIPRPLSFCFTIQASKSDTSATSANFKTR